MDVRIQPATVEDAPAVLKLQHLAYQSEARLYDDWSIPPLTQTLDALIAEFASSQVLKAQLGDTIVGAVRGRLAGDTCHIGRLSVHPDMQRRGIGSRLMQEMERVAPAVKRFELFTGARSASNIRLYERLGYSQYRVEELSPNVTLVYMHKFNTLVRQS